MVKNSTWQLGQIGGVGIMTLKKVITILTEDFMSFLSIIGTATILWVIASLLNTMLFNMSLAETGSWNFFQILVALRG